MYTANYQSLKNLKPPMTAVSISRGKPRWLKGGWLTHLPKGVTGINYDALAPAAKSLKASDEEYDRAYAKILAGLDPRKVYEDLGDTSVLLCFEKPNEFCHRRIVAEWLEFHLGIVVPEIGLARDETYVMTSEIYPHYVPPAEKLAWIEAKLAKGKAS